MKDKDINLQDERLKPEWDKNAVHDPETGMYTMPDAKPNDSGFVEGEIGGKAAFLPIPTYKNIRLLRFESQQLEVNESYEECKAAVDSALHNDGPAWFTFTDPTFGTKLAIPQEALVKVVAIVDGWKDLEAAAAELKRIEYAKAQERIQRLAFEAQQAKSNKYKRN
jgi:hypothetical protein